MPIDKDTPMGDVIKDFQQSDAPQFKGKSDEKKRQMAIAAKLNAEETEDLEEIDLIRVHNAVTKGGLNKSLKTKKLQVKKDLEDLKNKKAEFDKKLAAEELSDFEKQMQEKKGLWDNIHAKRKRIKNGSGERMRKPGSEGAPSDKDLKDSQKEEVEIQEDTFLAEATDKLMYLARIGLVSKNEIAILRKAMAVKKEGEAMPRRYRDVMFKVMDKLIGMIISKPQMFNRARRAVQEEVEIVDMFEETLTEAGYMDPPKNMKEFRKRYPKIADKIKSTDSGDFNTAVTSEKISESYSNHLGFVSKK